MKPEPLTKQMDDIIPGKLYLNWEFETKLIFFKFS